MGAQDPLTTLKDQYNGYAPVLLQTRVTTNKLWQSRSKANLSNIFSSY